LKLLSYPDFFKDRYRIFIEKAKKVLYENDPMISPNDENFIIIKVIANNKLIIDSPIQKSK
jgi:hypothetical protein